MPTPDLNNLAKLIRRDRELLLARWRQQVKQLPSAEDLDVPTLNDHIPDLIEELASTLEAKTDATIAETLREGSPPAHGAQRVQDGFDIAEVVAEYNILRGCVHDLAEANGLSLRGQAFHILNLVLDGAVSLAVQTYATQRALEVQNRRDEYLVFVAHDLRTPLNAIALAAKVLERTLPAQNGNTRSDAIIKTLQRNVGHLDGLVKKVLEENTNVQPGAAFKIERRNFDLWPLVEALIEDLHAVAETASTALINEVPDALMVFADAGLLRRILQNLIGNALIYTPRGAVRIGAAEHTDGTVECWVSDNGAGIAGKLLDKMFDKGEGDPERGESTGLGLAIVKTFVEAHSGTVRAESPQRQGTTIRFTLPPRATPC